MTTTRRLARSSPPMSFAEKDTLQIQWLEQILIAKVRCTFAGFVLVCLQRHAADSWTECGSMTSRRILRSLTTGKTAIVMSSSLARLCRPSTRMRAPRQQGARLRQPGVDRVQIVSGPADAPVLCFLRRQRCPDRQRPDRHRPHDLLGHLPREILATDAARSCANLASVTILTPQRSNGFAAMIERIKSDARPALQDRPPGNCRPVILHRPMLGAGRLPPRWPPGDRSGGPAR